MEILGNRHQERKFYQKVNMQWKRMKWESHLERMEAKYYQKSLSSGQRGVNFNIALDYFPMNQVDAKSTFAYKAACAFLARSSIWVEAVEFEVSILRDIIQFIRRA
uniref:Uncharacterized protein n=1 Tax=Megaselia scalaris TaxID=36166 RepID=T1GE73_MEGSC